MKKGSLCFLLIATVLGCTRTSSQNGGSAKQIISQRVGGSCEGCEAIYQGHKTIAGLDWVDTLPDWKERGPKLIISGTVYKSDGKTPAPDVVLYIYRTDQTGRYTNVHNEEGAAGRNGYIKGWVKTSKNGQYKFYTLKPAPYPGASIAAHIHPIVKEADKNEYYIDEYLFEGDPFLTNEDRARQEGRGGSGIIKLNARNGVLYGKRDIILGKEIPAYPSKE